MLLFIVGSMLAAQHAKADADLFGRYLATVTTTKPICDKPGETYLIISSRGLNWGDGITHPLIQLEALDRSNYYLWVNEAGKAKLYGVFIDRRHDDAIVISDESASMQAQIDQPGIVDHGLTAYARCPS